MITWVTWLVAALFFASGSRADDEKLCDSIQFATDFYTAVRAEKPTENLIVSPLSVQTALGLLLMGAEGSTAEQIVRGLHLHTNDRSTVAAHFEEILGRYGPSGVLKMANKVYTKTGYAIHPEFDEVARKQFNSEAENINFAQTTRAAEIINSWVQERTENKIKDLFSPDQLSSDTRMVLVNAIHFKAGWEEPFDKEYTKKADFWISETESVEVDMMYAMESIKYGIVDGLDASIGFLPYKNTNLSMMILLPRLRTGLDELENKLKGFDFSNLMSNLRTRFTRIRLPKFTIETTIDLKTVFTKMGMGEMFSNAANFPRLLDSSERLKIDDAVQKAFIKVDEEGTEAAAVTGAKAVPMSRKPQLYMDHPFFFAIVGPHDVLFTGSVRKF